MLNERRHERTHIGGFHLQETSKVANPETQRTDYWVPGAGEGREGEKKRECLLTGLGFLWG